MAYITTTLAPSRRGGRGSKLAKSPPLGGGGRDIARCLLAILWIKHLSRRFSWTP
jgi:hypothetical protein